MIGRQGQLAKLKAANPGLRVVLTGCSVREPDRAGLRRRYPAVDLFLRPGRGAGAGRPARAGIRAQGTDRASRHRRDDHGVGRTVVGAADHLAASRAAALEGGSVRRESAHLGLAADHLRLRQDLHLLHRAVQPRPGAQPPVRRDRRRGALARAAGLSRGHPARPERQQLRPRPAGRGALRRHRPGALGRPPPGPPGPARPRRAAARRSTRSGRPMGRPAIPRLRFVTSHPVGPVGSTDRGDGRVRRPSASTSTCRSSRATMRSCAGWAASTRSSTTSSGSPGSARRCPGSRSAPT